MKDEEIFKAEVSTELELPMYDAIAAGFPITSDYPAERLDFNRDFIKHPESTFYVKVKGDSMTDAGIYDGDLCLVDRAEEMAHGNIVAADCVLPIRITNRLLWMPLTSSLSGARSFLPLETGGTAIVCHCRL